jgi:predicted nucleic acid-binding protein|nr:MAG TPA: antitoxin [Caudoviricetes sp.]
MPKQVLLDTSFLIRLLKKDDDLHENAVDYFRYFLENDYILKISTIAIAEYCVKGEFMDLPFRNMQILPFNYDHAIQSGKLCEIAYRKKKERGAIIYPRAIVPNDVKMFAQADTEDEIVFFVSADTEAYKIFSLIQEERKLRFNYIDIRISYQNLFGILLL